MDNNDNVALFDMDGTLCDYEGSLIKELKKIKSPEEPDLTPPFWDAPDYIQERISLIMSSEDWWANIPRFQLGWDVMEIAEELDYKPMILTQGPRYHPSAWSGKKKWIDREIGPDVDITITRDKSKVYGKVLVDDYPGYIKKWLKPRERGLVIMPAHEWNADFTHRNIIRYDGSNIDQVREAMIKARNRLPSQSVDYR